MTASSIGLSTGNPSIYGWFVSIWFSLHLKIVTKRHNSSCICNSGLWFFSTQATDIQDFDKVTNQTANQWFNQEENKSWAVIYIQGIRINLSSPIVSARFYSLVLWKILIILLRGLLLLLLFSSGVTTLKGLNSNYSERNTNSASFTPYITRRMPASIYMNELMNNMSLGRFSRANVKLAPSTKSKTKATSIFAMYKKLMPGLVAVFAGREPSELCWK